MNDNYEETVKRDASDLLQKLLINGLDETNFLNTLKNEADSGNIAAMNDYAAVMMKKDMIDESKQYFLKAISFGNIGSIYNYAGLMRKINNKEMAIQYYKLAIEKGHICAIKTYALYIRDDNLEECLEYLDKAIAVNDYTAYASYAHVCMNNNKIEKAIEYAKKGADLHDFNSLEIYVELLIDTNKQKLIKYINNEIKYLENNNDYEKIGVCAVILSACNYNIKKNKKIYEKAINNGDIDSIYNYAVFLYNIDDIKNAKIYLQKAKELGCTDAEQKYIELFEK